jgi:hypothetical protein
MFMNNKIGYINFCIGKFAERFRMTRLMAYHYLSAYKGLEFLDKCYEAEHLLSAEDAVMDLRKVCRNNGGTI